MLTCLPAAPTGVWPTMQTAIAEKADGIAVCLVDPKAFDAPTATAIAAGIPVIAFNADVPTGSPNRRLAYHADGYCREGRRHRRLPGRPQSVRCADGHSDRRRHSGNRLQC